MPVRVVGARVAGGRAVPPGESSEGVRPPESLAWLGRARELSVLEDAYARAEQGGGQAILVAGPSGSGKSALLAELGERLRARGVPVLAGRARRAAGAPHPVAEVVRDAAAFLRAAGAEPAALDRTERVLGALEGGATAPNGVVSAFEWQARRTALLEALRAVLCDVAAIRTPAVLLDDLHLGSAATSALCAYVARAAASDEDGPSYLAVLAAGERPSDALAQAASRRIDLCDLDLESVRAALSTDAVVRAVLSRTGGDPASLAELVASLAGGGAAHAVLPGAATAGAIERSRLCDALAVFGRPVGIDVLRRLDPTWEAAGGAAEMERLVARGILVRSSRDGDGDERFAFADDRVQESVYAAIPPGDRRVLHLRAASLCDAEGDAERRAEHLLRAEAGAVAVAAAIAAADGLAAGLTDDRAVDLLERARPLAAGEQAEAIDQRLADLYERAGDSARALACAERLRASPCRSDEAAAALRVGRLQRARGDLAAAESSLLEARGAAAREGDALVEAQALCEMGEVAFARGALGRAETAAAGALARARLATPAGSPHLARAAIAARNLMAKVLLSRGDAAAAEPPLCDNLREARAFDLGVEEARALGNLALAALTRGDDERAIDLYRDGLVVCGRTGDATLRLMHLSHLGSLFHVRAEYGASLRCYHEAVALAKRIGLRTRLAALAADLAELYADLGDYDRAGAMADMAERVGPDDGGGMPVRLSVHVALARGLCAAGAADHAGARAALTEGLEEARAADNYGRAAWLALALADLALQDGDAGAAEAWLPDCRRWERVAPFAQVREAEIALLRGDPRAALATLDATSATLTRHALREGVLRALVVRAEAWAALGLGSESARAADAADRLAGEIAQGTPDAVRPALSGHSVRVRLRAVRAARVAVPAPLPAPPAVQAGTPRPAPAGDVAPAVVPGGTPALAEWRRRYPAMIGAHPRMQRVFRLIDRVAAHDSLVLIRGESGTGKELVAEAIHLRSARANRPLVKVNCAALVETLLLSELFGHERGAFTGALARRKGRFETADGGTIFLDEIGDISPGTQVALLRVLQERTFERVGGTTPIRVDVRIVCATHRDLESMVARGTFREDLYYRLRGIDLELPPLRERIEDLPALCEHVLSRIAAERGEAAKGIAADAAALLAAHRWPGNVREIENVLRSASLFCEGEEIRAADLVAYTELGRAAAPARRDSPGTLSTGYPPQGRSGGNPAGQDAFERARAEGLSLKELKRRIEVECITRALAETGGNITRAATLLRMKRPRLSQLIKELGVRARDDAGEASPGAGGHPWPCPRTEVKP